MTHKLLLSLLFFGKLMCVCACLGLPLFLKRVEINENVINMTFSCSNLTPRASLMSLKSVKNKIGGRENKEQKQPIYVVHVCFQSRLSSGHIPTHSLRLRVLIKREDNVYWSLREKLGHCSRAEQKAKIKSTATETEGILQVQTAPEDSVNSEPGAPKAVRLCFYVAQSIQKRRTAGSAGSGLVLVSYSFNEGCFSPFRCLSRL